MLKRTNKPLVLAISAALSVGIVGTLSYQHLISGETQLSQVKTTASSSDTLSSTVSKPSTDSAISQVEIVRKASSVEDITSITSENIDKTNGNKSTVQNASITAILAGDFSPLSGTWANGQGEVLYFDNQRLISSHSIINWEKEGHGILQGNLLFLENGSGAAAFYIPAGIDTSVKLDGSDVEFIDASDKSRERLLFGQTLDIIADPTAYYYHVSTERIETATKEKEEETTPAISDLSTTDAATTPVSETVSTQE